MDQILIMMMTKMPIIIAKSVCTLKSRERIIEHLNQRQ